MANFFRRLRERWAPARAPARLLQRDLDTYRLAILTSYRVHGRRIEEVSKATSKHAAGQAEIHYKALQSNLKTQLQPMLQACDRSAHEYEGAGPPEIAALRKSSQGAVQTVMGCSVDVATSTADNGGFGVFVRGSAPPGSVLCVWPGLAYNLEDIAFLEGFPDPQQNNSHLTARYDGTVIDAKPLAELEKAINGASLAELNSLGANKQNHNWAKNEPEPHILQWVANPWAVGHLVNHPPAGIKPNVLGAAFDWPADWVHAGAPVPNAPFRGRTHGCNSETSRESSKPAKPVITKGLVLVSIAPLRDGDELWLNYRFNPEHNDVHPRWYKDPCPSESERRWEPLAAGTRVTWG